MFLNSRQRADLDRHITGNFGEDQFPTTTALTIEQFVEQDGRELAEILEDAVGEGVIPALCTEGCEVEMDGSCPHGNPSILVALGMV